ncbi:chemotaxis protein [Deferribacter autotrophicus]|uniref:Chemotaxis protein n=1 Tax=Deferribacter autotrophicus TaxID=500465 RepID=A0A5A8F1G7_9BACT|nr:protein phosphatase CheZ [Deferribacter autotrophicus]KAA0257109.1 chemotaxis protein [Deferribacter autotrophicus]
MSEYLNDLNELIDIAKKINSGDYDLIEINIKPESELFQIAQYFNEALKKLKIVDDAFSDAYEDLPLFEKILREIINDMKNATESILSEIDKINFNIDSIKESLKGLKEAIKNGDFDRAKIYLNGIKDSVMEGEDICFDMIAALEFQDITKQKIDKLMMILNEIENRIADLIIKLGLKSNKLDPEKLSEVKEKKEVLEDQELVDKLLEEFGL